MNRSFYQLLVLISCALIVLSGCGGQKKVVSADAKLTPPPPQAGEEKITVKVIKKDRKAEKIKTTPVLYSPAAKPFKQATVPQAAPNPKKKAPAKVTAHYSPRAPKKVFEFVAIDGEKYLVPYPWRGKKVESRTPLRAELKRIPFEFSWEERSIFIQQETWQAFVAMAEAAMEDGVHLQVDSGFRSIGYQRRIFVNLMAKGRTWEDLVRYVAPPGYSEHMLGTAVDLHPSNWRFASTTAYEWLQEHASSFGFIERYPEKGGEGFPWESWHWKYVGPENVSEEMSKQTVAEYIKAKKKN